MGADGDRPYGQFGFRRVAPVRRLLPTRQRGSAATARCIAALRAGAAPYSGRRRTAEVYAMIETRAGLVPAVTSPRSMASPACLSAPTILAWRSVWVPAPDRAGARASRRALGDRCRRPCGRQARGNFLQRGGLCGAWRRGLRHGDTAPIPLRLPPEPPRRWHSSPPKEPNADLCPYSPERLQPERRRRRGDQQRAGQASVQVRGR